MSSDQPSLTDQFASLHRATQADAAASWLPDALVSLILAALARLFGQLEQMLALWQSGHLPPPAPMSSPPSAPGRALPLDRGELARGELARGEMARARPRSHALARRHGDLAPVPHVIATATLAPRHPVLVVVASLMCRASPVHRIRRIASARAPPIPCLAVGWALGGAAAFCL